MKEMPWSMKTPIFVYAVDRPDTLRNRILQWIITWCTNKLDEPVNFALSRTQYTHMTPEKKPVVFGYPDVH
jgi:hypothetical protein